MSIMRILIVINILFLLLDKPLSDNYQGLLAFRTSFGFAQDLLSTCIIWVAMVDSKGLNSTFCLVQSYFSNF